ncbi:MAG: GNAT family N-acetyltransferase [Phycisphaerales bacterium]
MTCEPPNSERPEPLPSHGPAGPPIVRLRPVVHADVPALFEMQLDPESNRLAGTKPRDRATFESVWQKILGSSGTGSEPPIPPDHAVVPRIILEGERTAGVINIFPRDGKDYIGYWLIRGFWSRGIATRAIALILIEFPRRPLFAQISADNTASLRALIRNGFAVISQEEAPETDRYLAGEVLTLSYG